MTHDATRAHVFALYDGELAGEARRVAQAHLQQCLECQEAIAGWKQAAGVCFRFPEVQTSEAFVDRVLDRIAAAQRRPFVSIWKPTVRWLIPALGLAALLVTMQPHDQPVSLDALLLVNGQDGGLQFMLASEPSSVETGLDAVLEGSR